MATTSQTEWTRLLGSARPEDRAALLRFARETPFLYGRWRDWKALYKQAESAADTELLGALIARLDTAPFPVTGPAALAANPAKIENVADYAVAGPYVYVLRDHSTRGNNVRIYDLSDPMALRERRSASVNGASHLCLRGSQLLVFSQGGWREPNKGHIFDISQPDVFSTTGTLDFPQATITQVSGTRLFLLRQHSFYSSERVGLSLMDTNATGALEQRAFIGIDHPIALAVSEGIAAVLTQADHRNRARLFVFDVSDTAHLRPLHEMEMPRATGVVLQGNHIFVTVGVDSRFTTSGDSGTTGLRVLRLSSGLLSAVGLQPGLREVASVDLGNARAVQVAGRYAYVCLSHSGSHRMKNRRDGGVRILDIGDPEHPQVVGTLDGIDAQDIMIVGDRAYVSAGAENISTYYGATLIPRTLYIIDIADPTTPRLIGASPSAETFGYMKRRARRKLRNLAQTDGDAFVRLAYETLAHPLPGRDALDLTTQWASADLLFGGTDRYAQQSHGRGRYRQVRHGMSRRTRDERAPEAWDRRLDLVSALLLAPGLPWQTQEMALKVLRANKITPPPVPIPVLVRLLNSPSLLLVSLAARQAAARLGEGAQIDPAAMADAYFFGNAQARRQIHELLEQRSKPDWWGPQFARRVFQRATSSLRAGRLSRRQVGAAIYAVTNFPDALSAEMMRPVFGPLLATGREELTAYVLRAVGRATPAEVAGWLVTLTDVPDDVRAQAMAALGEGLGEQKFDYAAARALVQADSDWVREQGWRLIAHSRTDTETVTRVWGELLDSPQMTPALETAFGSSDALSLLRRIRLDGDALLSRLESRPFLAHLLSGPAFALVARTLPAAVLLNLITAMLDAPWQQVRVEFVEALGEGGRLGDFWHAAWDILGGGGRPLLEARLLGDPGFAGSFLTLDDPTFLETTTNPVFDDLLGRWAQAHADLFPKDSALLLAGATHQLPAVRDWALRRVRVVGLSLPFALRLLESELPASVAVGQTYFEAAPSESPDEFEGALALCDSPKASVRAWGCGFIDRRWQSLPTPDLIRRLTENADPRTQAFLAAKLREVSATDTPEAQAVQEFDRQVLRVRDRARRAKELVKARRDRAPALTLGELDTATLLEMARSRTPRDAEWALGQLARLALAGQEVEGLTVDGLAGI